MVEANCEVKVLGAWPSPFVMRPRIALNLKSVEYDFIAETMNPKSELLLKSNPVHKKIPVLLHNDKPVCESNLIVQYIDEAFSSGTSILPSDPYDRAVHRFWAAFVDDKWFPAMMAASKAETAEAKATALEQLKEWTILLEETFVKLSNGKPFFGGDQIGYVDIAFGSFLGWVRVSERNNNVKLLDEETTPSLVAWADKFCAHEAVKDVMPDTDKLVEFAKIIMAKNKPSSST
ncbi:glutathione S-transferase U17-like [Silene latifolia]|uniref:glutathione S-transferase U17-like n=1 Tax=Silene latifolia TaxID=37657 RepID=UPI003D78440E